MCLLSLSFEFVSSQKNPEAFALEYSLVCEEQFCLWNDLQTTRLILVVADKYRGRDGKDSKYRLGVVQIAF